MTFANLRSCCFRHCSQVYLITVISLSPNYVLLPFLVSVISVKNRQTWSLKNSLVDGLQMLLNFQKVLSTWLLKSCENRYENRRQGETLFCSLKLGDSITSCPLSLSLFLSFSLSPSLTNSITHSPSHTHMHAHTHCPFFSYSVLHTLSLILPVAVESLGWRNLGEWQRLACLIALPRRWTCQQGTELDVLFIYSSLSVHREPRVCSNYCVCAHVCVCVCVGWMGDLLNPGSKGALVYAQVFV